MLKIIYSQYLVWYDNKVEIKIVNFNNPVASLYCI